MAGRFGRQEASGVNTDAASRGGAALAGPLADDQRLQVWMRPAMFPTFRKLAGVVRQRLPAGAAVRVEVGNRYNTYRFGGAKAVVLTTASWLGGRNVVLGWAAVGTGCASAVAAVVLGGAAAAAGVARKQAARASSGGG